MNQVKPWSQTQIKTQFIFISLKVYDFSPVKGEKNWKKAGRMFKVEDYLPLPSDVDTIKELGATNDKSKSLVPFTIGMDGNG